jgi:hypothetical protein
MKYLLLIIVIILLLFACCSPTSPGSYYKADRGWMNHDLRRWDIPNPDTTLITTEGPIIRIIKKEL